MKTFSYIFLVVLGLSSCDLTQKAIESAASKSDKIIGTYTVNRLEVGTLAFNYPGKNSLQNNASVPVATMRSMGVNIIKYSDEKVGISAPIEYEFGGSPTFSQDPKAIRTIKLTHEPDRTSLTDDITGADFGYIKNNILTINSKENNQRFFLTAQKN